MPFYRLICRGCHASFEMQASISQRTAGEIVCPQCGSAQVDTDYSAGSAHVQTSRAEEVCPHAARCGGSCGCAGRHGK